MNHTSSDSSISKSSVNNSNINNLSSAKSSVDTNNKTSNLKFSNNAPSVNSFEDNEPGYLSKLITIIIILILIIIICFLGICVYRKKSNKGVYFYDESGNKEETARAAYIR